jgi:urease accessory protein
MANSALLRLLTWLSPGFPTGGFAYSSGLEYVVETGVLSDEASLADWLQTLVTHGALWSDVILLRTAYRGEDVSALGLALCTTAERRLETLAQGSAFVRAAAAWSYPARNDEDATPYPIAVAHLAAAHDVPEDDTVLAYLHAATANLVSAAIRLIPLGQAAGLRVQAGLEPTLLAAAARRDTELGTAAWSADIAAMRHETQYTRLFRT